MEYFAHKGHKLAQHLNDVGSRAAGFAQTFQAELHSRIAGALHDLGKAEEEFQKRIRSDDKEGDKQPHAHHGAMLALEAGAWPIALAINGHHAGLHNRGNVEKKKKEYLPKALHSAEALHNSDASWSLPQINETIPQWLKMPESNSQIAPAEWIAVEFFTRLLFSTLIDADRLDTEEFEKGQDLSVASRLWAKFDAEELLDKLKTELSARYRKAVSEGKASAEVLQVRKEVGDWVWQKAPETRGLFSMTVPTGGGKTLASMLFALAHAAFHNSQLSPDDPKRLRRVIVVIPYLSIIEQTAGELIEIFGKDIVLEHHSQAEEEATSSFKKEKADGAMNAKAKRRRLATENWDAPVVVTTSVQFFDSLFSRKAGKARKLHNICQSVVIFDEVQTLPPLLLQPLLGALAELSNPERPYGCSMLFCTATQPALEKSDDLPCGLEGVRPIIPPERAKEHFRQLARVIYDGLDSEPPTKSWEQIAQAMLSSPNQQALAIVNTRNDARLLHRAIKKALDDSDNSDAEGLFHLSTWMMPQHRWQVLDEVRRRLANEDKLSPPPRCLLVSTQCIEAGVDVDFPEVWRAFGPYDSIVQAAGRCNRNGLRLEKGIVHVFHPEEEKFPAGLYETATIQTELLRKLGLAQPHDPESFETYFRLLYQLSVPDECAIQKARAQWHFEEVEDLFKFIDDNTISVLLRYQRIDGVDHETSGAKVYAQAEKRGFFVREDWRKFQSNIVNLPYYCLEQSPFRENLAPAFAKESGLYIWQGNYRGGLEGYGLDFEGTRLEEMNL